MTRALDYANEALHVAKKNNWHEGEMLAELAIGDCFPQVMEYDTAIEHYKDALKYAREFKRQDVEIKVLEQLAEAYSRGGYFADNVRVKLQLIALAKQIGDLGIEYKHLNYLAGAYLDMKVYDSAIYYYRQCLDIGSGRFCKRCTER